MIFVVGEKGKKMIDENKLIEEIGKAVSYFDSGDTRYGLKVALAIVQKQPNVMEWIPVAYRLPETPLASIYSEDVFVACSNGRSLLYKVGWYNNEEKEWNKALENYDVVAWMPIPKYKGECE